MDGIGIGVVALCRQILLETAGEFKFMVYISEPFY
jgi:hypothetical protein